MKTLNLVNCDGKLVAVARQLNSGKWIITSDYSIFNDTVTDIDAFVSSSGLHVEGMTNNTKQNLLNCLTGNLQLVKNAIVATSEYDDDLFLDLCDIRDSIYRRIDQLNGTVSIR